MKESEEVQPALIVQLFQTLVLAKSKLVITGPSQPQSHSPQSLSFYQNFANLLSQCKSSIKNLCSTAHKLQVMIFLLKESSARKIVNTLMFLTKDSGVLLDDGVLNLYMDLVEMKEKMVKDGLREEMEFVGSCVGLIEPLLLEFFVFRMYKKSDIPKLNKNPSIARKSSVSSDEESEGVRGRGQKRKQTIRMQAMEQIRGQIYSSKINELLQQFLDEYEMQLSNLQQVCKICSKNIKVHHLQEHVVYCQKKYLIKQDLKSLQKKIVLLANELIAKRKGLENSGVCHINSGPLTAVQDLDVFGDAEYGELLFEVVNVHRIGSLKGNSKKVYSENRIRDGTDKYEELVGKFNCLLAKSQGNDQLVENIALFLTMETRILSLTLELRTVELQHQNLREIVSSSTLKAPSSKKMSQKKSRFAGNTLEVPQARFSRNLSCSSKVCFSQSQHIDSNSDQAKNQPVSRQSNLQSYQNFDEDQLPMVTLKTKQSLGNSKNVHFHMDDSEEDENSPQLEDSKNKKSRRVMSMVMFDDSDESDFSDHVQKMDQHQNSQKSSCQQQSVGIKEFEILKFLGKGAFGKVYAVRKKNTSDLYALKMIDIDENWGPQEFQQIRNEHEIFKKVAGEHLVQAPYCFSEGAVHVFMMEFMPGGDLSKVLEEEVYLEEERAKYVIAEIVLAIEHLHRADIIHRDLKPENLVIDERGHLKLTDFGLSQIKLQNKIEKVMNLKNQKQQMDKRRRTRRTGMVAAKSKAKIIGTPDYIAPQIINSISINNRSIDWWSLGVISYEILIGVRPFCGNSIEEVLDNILKFNIEWPEIGQEEGMISEKAYDFIQQLLSKDFVNRLGAQDIDQIKSHAFFEGINWQRLKSQPAHIMPNYAKIKELLQMKQDQVLRSEIQEKTQKVLSKMKMPELENFIRFDILGEKTVRQANKAISKKTGTLKRLQSIKDTMVDKENEVGKKGNRKIRVRSSKELNRIETEIRVSTQRRWDQ